MKKITPTLICLIVITLFVLAYVSIPEGEENVTLVDTLAPKVTYEEELQINAEKIATVEESSTEIVQETPAYSETEVYSCYTHNIQFITAHEYALMARVVMSEAGGESFETQLAVAETILNRVNSDKFPNTIEEVINQCSQYSLADNGEPTTSVLEAVQTSIETQTYPSNMVFFRSDYYHKFEEAEPYKKIGALYFSTKKSSIADQSK